MLVYLVEDDESIRELVVYSLNASGYEAVGFREGAVFLAALSRIPDLVVLDIMLPGEDGLSILRRLRKTPATAGIPVIMLTAKGTEYEKVLGLDSGADDYVSKPFGVMELLSRIRAVLRRSRQEAAPPLAVGPLSLDPDLHSVTAGGVEIPLTVKEFQLLRLFLENPGLVFNREQLLERIWGYDFDGGTRTVDVHIRTLRRKLGPSGDWIETVRGVGYRVRKA